MNRGPGEMLRLSGQVTGGRVAGIYSGIRGRFSPRRGTPRDYTLASIHSRIHARIRGRLAARTGAARRATTLPPRSIRVFAAPIRGRSAPHGTLLAADRHVGLWNG